MHDLLTTVGQPLAAFIVTALGAVLTRFVWSRIQSDWARGFLERAYAEVIDAVLLVWQTYVSAIKERSADGKLTDAERAEARNRAVDTVIHNLGETGMKRLAKVLGFGDTSTESATDRAVTWLEDKTEAAVATLRSSGVIANGVRKGTVAQPSPVQVIAGPF